MELYFIVAFIFWVFVGTVIGFWIGVRKGRPVNGAILGFLLGLIGIVIIAVMPPTEEVQRKRRQEQADIYLAALEAHGRGGGGSSTPGVQLPTRDLIIVEAIKRDPSLAGASDPQSLKRLADAITELENEFRTREELRSANELITNQEQEKADQQEADRLRAEASLRVQEEARVKAEAVERAKVARDLRIAAMGPMKRWVVLHKPLAGGILAVVVVALIAGGISISVNLANQEAQRVAAEKAAALEQATLVEERELAERTELLASCDSATIKKYASDLELQEGWLLACDDPEVLEIIIELAPQPNCEIEVGTKLSPLEIAAFTKCPEDKRGTLLAWQGQGTPPKIVALLATDSSPRVRRAVALYSSDPKVLELIPFGDSTEVALALAGNTTLPADAQDRLIETQSPEVLDALMKNPAVTFLAAQKLVKRPDQALIAVSRFGSTDGGVGVYAGELSRPDVEKIIQIACRTLKPQVPKWEAANDKGYYTLRPYYNVC